jgi:outer membrane protein assembly factor BamA
MRLSYEAALPFGNRLLGRQTVDLDIRQYLRLGTNGLFAVRGHLFKSWGEYPDFTFFGGNSEMRGYDYLQFLGQKAFYTNVELRIPLIEAMATPIGVLGGVRGVFFFNLGAVGFNDSPFDIWSTTPQEMRSVVSFSLNPDTGKPQEVYGNAVSIKGFRLLNGRASYGIGLSTMALGFPIHFDWSWRTLFNKAWEDSVFAQEGASEGLTGSEFFRKVRFAMWIGYDF